MAEDVLKLRWIERDLGEVRRFQLEDEPEILHIIRTGFEGRYLVVHEDAYERDLGETEILNHLEIFAKYKIRI